MTDEQRIAVMELVRGGTLTVDQAMEQVLQQEAELTERTTPYVIVQQRDGLHRELGHIAALLFEAACLTCHLDVSSLALLACQPSLMQHACMQTSSKFPISYSR